MTTITGAIASKLLRAVISDYNFWGESESDSPLSIKRTKSVLDEKKILSLDATARRKAEQTEGYKPPTRTVVTKKLHEVFLPLVKNSLEQLEGKSASIGIAEDQIKVETIQSTAESLEYYVQLYSVFNQLDEPTAYYVEDSAGDPYTGLFITGKSSDGETVFAQSLLIQT